MGRSVRVPFTPSKAGILIALVAGVVVVGVPDVVVADTGPVVVIVEGIDVVVSTTSSSQFSAGAVAVISLSARAVALT